MNPCLMLESPAQPLLTYFQRQGTHRFQVTPSNSRQLTSRKLFHH